MDVAAIVFILFAFIGIAGNLISILALSRSIKLRNATTTFIVNLCVADLLFCSFGMPMSALTLLKRDFNFGPVLCRLFPLVRYSNGSVSLLSVIAITINRYILMVHPSLYPRVYKKLNVVIMIVFIWGTSLIMLLFPLFDILGKNGYDPEMDSCSVLRLNKKSLKNFIYIAAFIFTFLVFTFCYIRIFYVVRKKSKNMRESIRKSSISPNDVRFSSKKCVFRRYYKHSEMPANPFLQQKQKRTELRALRVIAVVFATLFICFFPVSFVKIFRKEDDLPYLSLIGYFGVYISNIINPVIYILMSKEYRKAYSELLCNEPKKKISTIDI